MFSELRVVGTVVDYDPLYNNFYIVVTLRGLDYVPVSRVLQPKSREFRAPTPVALHTDLLTDHMPCLTVTMIMIS